MKICMYGAAKDSINEMYKNEAKELGKTIANHGDELVYGGGSSGLMGACSEGVYKNNGIVMGVTPHFMHDFEPTGDCCTHMIHCNSMAERKTIMEENADAFIVCPGGIGTYDEFFQILTLKELGRLDKPIIIFNINNYYKEVIHLINVGIKKGFIRKTVLDLFFVCNSIKEIYEILENN